MLGSIGVGEIVMIVLITLLLFGPHRIPEVLRQIGRLTAEIRHAFEQAQQTVREEVERMEQEIAAAASESPASPDTQPPEREGSP